MAHFTYTAKHSGGEIYTGEAEATDHYELYKVIRESGGEIVSYKETKKGGLKGINISFSFLGRIKTQEKIIFARNLGAMIQAGLAASRALSVMERQTKNVALKKVIISLNDDISKGKTLADAMMAYPKMFSSLFISMVRAGEESGNLADSLRIVALQMDRSYALSRRIRGALMYPAVVIILMIIISIVLLTYIVPTLTSTFAGLNVTLPASTQFIVNISNIIRFHGIILAIVIIALVTSFVWWKRRPQGKSVIDWFVLKIPIMGNIVKEVNAARTARTLSSLLTSGVDMVEAVRITTDVVQNVHYKKVLETAQMTLTKGDPLSKVFSENEKLYPTFLTEMMSVGEETGKMGEMLLGVAVFYEDDVEQATKDMSTVIEPLIMVVIGAGVGFFAVAMITPMYSLVNVIS
jgi:type IV pilus assembly protein PilC